MFRILAGLIAAQFFLQASVRAEVRVVVDSDDRLDKYEVTDPELLALSRSIFTFIPKDKVIDRGDGTSGFAVTRSYRQYMNLCDGEKFGAQPSPGTFCTGFLIGPDLALTAGHCVEDDELSDFCDKYYLLFDHELTAKDSPRSAFDGSQLVECSKVEARSYSGTKAADFAVLRLAKPAEGRKPFSLSRGEAAVGAKLMTIGHPKGLPKKFVLDSRVLVDSRRYFFSTDTDIFKGNSGGPAIAQGTYEVEGIASHYSGAYASSAEPDFVFDKKAGCNRTFVCNTGTGCKPLNSWTRISAVRKAAAKLLR